MPCTNISNSHPGQKYVKFQFVEHFYKFEASTRTDYVQIRNQQFLKTTPQTCRSKLTIPETTPQTCRRVSNFLLEISKSNFWTFRLRKCRISSLPISKKTQFVKQTCEKWKYFKTTLKTQGRVHDFHSAILKSHCRTLRPRRCRISKLRMPP